MTPAVSVYVIFEVVSLMTDRVVCVERGVLTLIRELIRMAPAFTMGLCGLSGRIRQEQINFPNMLPLSWFELFHFTLFTLFTLFT